LESVNSVVEGLSGLEKIGGLRELEDLRGPFIISLRVQKMSGEKLINML